ncbi:MAG: hypothetical protein R3B46_04545 [Phycisphaerales bacterium]
MGIAMGVTFRGLFVNYLWIHAPNKLKQDGKFYEAIQLSKRHAAPAPIPAGLGIPCVESRVQHLRRVSHG